MRGAEIANGGNPIAPDRNIDMFRLGTGSIVNRAAFDDDVEVRGITWRGRLFRKN
jgi:hypothetical protein